MASGMPGEEGPGRIVVPARGEPDAAAEAADDHGRDRAFAEDVAGPEPEELCGVESHALERQDTAAPGALDGLPQEGSGVLAVGCDARIDDEISAGLDGSEELPAVRRDVVRPALGGERAGDRAQGGLVGERDEEGMGRHGEGQALAPALVLSAALGCSS